MRLAFGTSSGPAAQAMPSARLGALALLGTAVLVADASRLPGSLWVLALAGLWAWACGFPWRPLGTVVAAGAVTFLTFAATLATASWLGLGEANGLVQAWTMALKGTALAALAWATLRTFRPGALLRALDRLPGPLTPILTQITQQVLNLADESQRITQAWRLRGAAGRLHLGLLRAAPLVWLPRVAHRADRVAEAMELRGMPGHGLFRDSEPFGKREALLLAFALLGLTASALLRWGAR